MTKSTNPKTLQYAVLSSILFLMLVAVLLWWQTPDLFLYFNQAFCSH